MLLPLTIGIIVATIVTIICYIFYEDILDGIDWLATANKRKQERIWNRIVEMKRENEERE